MSRRPLPLTRRLAKSLSPAVREALLYGILLVLAGCFLVTRFSGFGLPFLGVAAFDTYRIDSDDMIRLVGTTAAIHEPIDWLRPIALERINDPEGSTAVYIDAVPLLTLLMRVGVQVFGLALDPAAAISWVYLLALLAAPAAAALVARAMGAGRLPALIAGCAIPLLEPLAYFAGQHQHSILPWMPVALVVAAAVGVERGRYFSRLAVIAAVSSWFIHPYHGAMSSLVTGITAIVVARRAPRGTLGALLLATLAGPLLLVMLGGIGRVAGSGGMGVIDGAGIATFIDARLIGLPIVPDEERAFAWGILLPIAALFGGRLLLRQAPGAALIAGVSAWLASGAVSGGGFVPDWCYLNIPFFGIFRYSDRFALLTALICFGAAAAQLSGWAHAVRRSRVRRQTLIAVAGTLLLVAQGASSIGNPSHRPPDAFFTPYPADLEAAERSLLAAHDRLHPEPFRGCVNGWWEIEVRRRFGFEAHLNLLAAEAGMPSTSVQVVRYPDRDCNAWIPVIAGDLIVLTDPSTPAPLWLSCVVATAPEEMASAIRFCSADAAAIARYDTDRRRLLSPP